MTWRRAVFALFAVAAGTNVPTPLLLVYQDRLDLSAEVLTALFGSYAAGLVPALFLAGPLSDRLGRRRVAIPGIALSALASLAFAAAGGSIALLFGARFLQGVVSGIVFSVGSAWVGELSLASGEREGAGGRRAAFAMTAGFSLGPLTSGVLGQYAPWPTVLSYLVHTALVVVGLAVAARLPETVDLVARAQDDRRGRVPLIQAGDGWLVATVLGPIAVCVYAYPATVIGAVPLLVDLPAADVAVTGVLAGVTLGAGTVVAGLQKRLGAWTAVVGAALGAIGFACAALFAVTGALPWIVLAAPLLGAGSGLCLAAGLALTGRLAAPSRRGALTSLFLACAYVGFAAPFVTATAARATSAAVPLAVGAGVSALLAVRLLPVARRGQL